MGDAQKMTEHEVPEPRNADPTTDSDQVELYATPLGDEVMGLLAEHVPLALLADLAAPSDQVSTEILESEGLPDDAWWETTAAADEAAASDDASQGDADPSAEHSLTA